MIPKHKLKILQREVKGHYGIVAEKAAVSKETVSRVLAGDWMNEAVINAAIAVRDELREHYRKLSEKI